MNTQQQIVTRNFITYLDERGLTSKAERVQNLLCFVQEVAGKIKPILETINVEFITDPATVISNRVAKDPVKLKQMIKRSIDLWEELNWPTKDALFVRTAGWDRTFFYPMTEIDIHQDLDQITNQLTDFITENNPEQLILHPRISNERALKDQIAIRSKEIPGAVYIQLGRGGQKHIRGLEEMDEHYEFSSLHYPPELPAVFRQVADALSVITPVANACVTQYVKEVSATNLPVYEFKGVNYNGKHLLNLFDYELI